MQTALITNLAAADALLGEELDRSLYRPTIT